jgi:hypothetical protein
LSSLAVLSLGGCVQNSDRTVSAPNSEATGKGNGGNGLQLSSKDIDAIFSGLKPRLQIVFEGLRYLALTEKSASGSTDLQGHAEMTQNLLKMFDGDAPALKDLGSESNIILQKGACVDIRGVKNAAAAVLGDAGGPICFSSEMIQNAAIKNFDHAAEIFILALATHEFVHHFIQTGKLETDEKAAQEIQNLVEQQLVRQAEIPSSDVITTDDSKYLEQFREYARVLFETVIPTGPKQ